ncbi:MAG: protein kinase domain-containing protein [Oscillochloridaceae bacterium umkhey_bin13]
MSTRDLLMPGSMIGGRYRTRQLLGTGGMGAVYAAEDTRLEQQVALKLMTNSDGLAPAAFEKEARLLAALNHPSLPRVIDYFSDERGQFLVMDYIEGQDLEAVRRSRNGSLPFRDVLRWTIDLLDVLEYLHSRQPPVIHRDIKPANLKVTPEGAIYLLDFGLAKRSLSNNQPSDRSLFAYTAQYAPPEQILGSGTDARTDLFSLAATIYCLLSGTPPVDAMRRNQAAARHEAEPLAALDQLNHEVPATFSAAITRTLALEARQRPQQVAELRALLLGTSLPGTTTVLSATSLGQTTSAAAQDATVTVAAALGQAAPLIVNPPKPRRLQVWFDPAERAAELGRLLDAFTEPLMSERVREALGRETLGQIRLREQQTRARLNEPFMLVVMGDFKRGKSTLVNALLGRELAPSNITPETVTINRFTHGSRVNVVAQLANNSRVQLDPEDLRAERLEPLLRQLGHPVEYVNIEAPVPWLEGMLLVDMPGTGDLDWRFDAQVQAYLPQADAIIYVISARAPLSASELAFLRRAVAPHEFPKLLFVVNQIDAIRNQADVERIIDLVRTRVDQVFPGATVYGLSSLDALSHQLGRRPPQPQRSVDLQARFAHFQRELHETVLLNRDLIQIDRAVHQALALSGFVEEQAGRLRTAIDHNHQQLQGAIAQCEDSNSALRQAMHEQRAYARNTIIALGEQTKVWMQDFVGRIQRDLIASLHQYRYADVQRYLTFYLQDVVGRALGACVETHQAEIAALLERTRSAVSTAIADQTELPSAAPLNTANQVARLTYNQATWSDLDTIHYVTSFAQQYIFGAVGSMALSLVFAAADRRVDDSVQLRAYQEQLRKALPGLRTALTDEISALYQRLADEVDTQINTAYEADIVSALATLRQAESLQQAGAQRIQEVQQICDTLLHEAQLARNQFATFQASLWYDELKSTG